MIKCPICNKEFKILNKSHLINAHKLTLEEFELLHPNFSRVSDEFKTSMIEHSKRGWRNFKENNSDEVIKERIHKQTKSNKKRNLSIAKSMVKVKRYNTSIEIKVKEQLTLNSIKYKFQKIFHDDFHDIIAVSDFFLPELNLVIECNGDFWHCNPNKFLDGPVSDIQRDRIKKDEVKKKIYENNNVNLLILWEEEINKNDFDILSYLQDRTKWVINSDINS